MAQSGSGRLPRLAEELDESGLAVDPSVVVGQILLEEIDRALRPPRPRTPGHERGNHPRTSHRPVTLGLGNAARHHPREAWRPTTAGRSSLCGRALELGLAARRTIKTNGSSSTARPAPSGISSVMSSVFDRDHRAAAPIGDGPGRWADWRLSLGGHRLAPRTARRQVAQRPQC